MRTSAAIATLGSFEFTAITQRDRVADVARRIDVAESTARNYCRGLRAPAPAVRARIAKVYGIEVKAWEAPPPRVDRSSPSKPKTPRGDSAAAPNLQTSAGRRERPSWDEIRTASADRLLELVLQFFEQMREGSGLAPRDRIALGAATTSVIRALAVARGERLSEAALVRTPVFRAIVDRLMKALGAWPDALHDVIVALEAAEAGERDE